MSTADKANANALNEHTRAWLEKLPENVRPKALPEQFARIANRLSSLWKHPDELIEYIDELLVDTRGGRSGFPMTIASELATLKDYYEHNVDPERGASYLWDPRRTEEEVAQEREEHKDKNKKG
jgi:hypothetical protein